MSFADLWGHNHLARSPLRMLIYNVRLTKLTFRF
jgi:hypothetical protein